MTFNAIERLTEVMQGVKENLGKIATPPSAETPAITFEDGKVKMACATEGSVIHYTDDGSTPTGASTVYSAAIDQPAEETTYKAMATASGYVDSEVASETFTPTPADDNENTEGGTENPGGEG